MRILDEYRVLRGSIDGGSWDGDRAVVFDLDGLMFDTEALFCRVSTQALAARGKAFTRETMQSLIGRRADEARAI